MRKTPTAAELPFVVKVCGVTTEYDLETSVEAGANAIGFNFYAKSPRCLTPGRAKQIAQAVQGPYIKVGVFVNPSEDELLDTVSQMPLDVLQLHGAKSPADLGSSFRIWQSVHPGKARDRLDPSVEAWLLDTPTAKHGGSGKSFDWSQAAGFPGRAIVAGGLDGANVAAAIAAAHPWGVDACSRLESEAGKKDPARIKDFVENALTAFRAHQEIHS